jgi:hypothetical protein
MYVGVIRMINLENDRRMNDSYAEIQVRARDVVEGTACAMIGLLAGFTLGTAHLDNTCSLLWCGSIQGTLGFKVVLPALTAGVLVRSFHAFENAVLGRGHAALNRENRDAEALRNTMQSIRSTFHLN